MAKAYFSFSLDIRKTRHIHAAVLLRNVKSPHAVLIVTLKKAPFNSNIWCIQTCGAFGIGSFTSGAFIIWFIYILCICHLVHCAFGSFTFGEFKRLVRLLSVHLHLVHSNFSCICYSVERAFGAFKGVVNLLLVHLHLVNSSVWCICIWCILTFGKRSISFSLDFPKRHIFTLLCFFGMFSAYTLRFTLPVAIVAMVKVPKTTGVTSAEIEEACNELLDHSNASISDFNNGSIKVRLELSLSMIPIGIGDIGYLLYL